MEASVNGNTINIVKLYGPDDGKLEIINLDFEELDEISDFISRCVNEEEDQKNVDRRREEKNFVS